MQDLNTAAHDVGRAEEGQRREPLPDIAALGWINRFILGIASIALLTAMVLMVYEGSARYLADTSFDWIEEVVRYLLVWAFFATLGVAGLRHCHIRTEMLLARLPFAMQRLTWLLACLIGMAYAVILGGSSIAQLQRYYVTRMVSDSTLEIPMWPVFLALPVGSVLLFIYYVIAWHYAWRGQDPFTPHAEDDEPEAVPML